MIPPIQTKYKGYRMRSRTEARWAVAFDSLGLKFMYEHEGFDVPNVGYYLIDFYIPPQKMVLKNIYIEIKGLEPTKEEKKKAHNLSIAAETPVLILSGMPGDHEWVLYHDKYSFNSSRYSREKWWAFAGIKTTGSAVAQAYEAARSARFEHGVRP